MSRELERARDALHYIPPDLPRDEWVRVGMGAHAAGLSFDDFDSWSAGAGNYDASAARDTWRSFKDAGPIGRSVGAGTLYRVAAEHGWRTNASATRYVRAARSRRSKTLPLAKPQHDAVALWERLKPATADHPYIVAKHAQGAPLERLRVVPEGDMLRLMGESMAGALVVPVYRPDGSISSLQFIAPPETAARLKADDRPSKLCLTGASMEGWHTVGQVVPGDDVYVCEGIGTAWACWMATGKAAVCAFGWSRVAGVARALRKQHPAARLVLVPDAGMESKAQAIARELSASVAELPEGWPRNSDVCDYAAQEGLPTLADLLKGAKDAPLPFEVVSFADLEGADPPPPERVWGPLVPAGHVTLLSAHGGTGKSMVALMLCVAVSLGKPLFDIPTRQGVAVFYSGEDGADLVRYRLKWICRSWGISPRELDGRLFILDATNGDPTLFTEENGVRREGVTTPTYAGLRTFMLQRRVSLMVVDNASDAFDASEIDRARVRGFVRALARLARENGAGVLLLAHVDKGTSRGDRGSNAEAYSGSTAWHNSARSRLFMKREEDGCLLLEHQKWNVTEHHPALRLWWAKDGIPTLDDFGQPEVKAIAERAHIRALLRLVHQFTQRGEHVSTGLAGPSTAPRLLKSEMGYPPRLKDRDALDLLRQAERKGLLTRGAYKTRSRHTAERWEVTPAGMAEAGIELDALVARVA